MAENEDDLVDYDEDEVRAPECHVPMDAVATDWQHDRLPGSMALHFALRNMESPTLLYTRK